MRDLAKRYRLAVEQSRAIVAGDQANYPQLVVRTIDHLAPAIADLIESEPSTTCPHCLALALENFLIAPAVATLMSRIGPRLRARTLRMVIEVKSASMGFTCVDPTEDPTVSQMKEGLH